MSISHLRTFVEVYRQGSFTRAAAELGLTQPAVTQHVAALEALLGRKLFERTPRGIIPMTIARDLARRIGDHLDLAEEALASARARSTRLVGTVHICGPSDILSDLLAPHLRSLTSRNLSVQMRPAGSTEAIEALLSGNADFGFAVAAPDDSRLGFDVAGREELLLVAAPEIASRIRAAGDLGRGLERTPFVSYSIQRDLIRQWSRHHGLDIGQAEERVTAPDLRALRGLVQAELGWSVLPRYLVAEATAHGTVECLHCPNGPLFVDYHMIWTKASRRTPRLVRARQLLLDSFGNLQGQSAG